MDQRVGQADVEHQRRTLEAARALGDCLIVCLNSDASVRRLKGDERPLVGQDDRAAVLRALACVDAVVVFDEDTPLELIRQIRPDVLVKGEDWAEKGVVGREWVESHGGEVVLAPLLAGISATLAWGVFALIGLDFPVALALWMGIISQFVPVIGTYLGGALPLIIALLDSPGKALAVVGYVVVYQQIENYLLAPKLTARTMSLHPAVSFGSAIAGGTLMGVPGALMALPVAATLQAFISTYIDRYKVVESPLTEEPPRKDEE